MAAIVLAAALLPGCGVFSHKLARPIVHHAQRQWTHENTAIYGSVSSFRVRRMQARMKPMNFSISTASRRRPLLPNHSQNADGRLFQRPSRQRFVQPGPMHWRCGQITRFRRISFRVLLPIQSAALPQADFKQAPRNFVAPLSIARCPSRTGAKGYFCPHWICFYFWCSLPIS